MKDALIFGMIGGFGFALGHLIANGLLGKGLQSFDGFAVFIAITYGASGFYFGRKHAR